MTTTLLTSPLPTTTGTTAPALVRPVGARFHGALVEPARATAVASVPAYPVGSRFPRRSAAERAQRIVLDFAASRTEPVGARFPRRAH